MDNLNLDIKNKIIDFLKTTKHGASSSEIAKSTGHNRITVTKYMEIMNAHKLLTYEEIAQAKIWQLSESDMKKKILVVDDEPHIVELIKLCLMNDKWNILEAYSGLDALDKVKKESPDLIVLDIMMPGLNGYEVCQRLKQDAFTQHIPIIILSAKGDLKDKLKGVNMGADDYLTKPFDPAELEARVSSLLSSVEESDMNQLTGMQGKSSLISYLSELSATQTKYNLFKVKVNNMKEFNRSFGFKRGNDVILLISRLLYGKLLKDSMGKVYHLPNDIFVVVASDENYDKDISMSFKKMYPFIFKDSSQKVKISLLIERMQRIKDIKAINLLILKIEA